MATFKKKRWWPLWRRQKAEPNRLERTASTFGNEFVEVIYQTLFPDILENDGLNTIERIYASNCFENGAFVFKDNDRSLFKILIGDNNTGAQTDQQYGILVGTKYAPGFSRKPLSHLLPQLLKKQGSKGGWNQITFIFYGPNGSTTEVSAASNLGDIQQYERLISPSIKFICNPRCRGDDSPEYCNKLNIQKKPHGKGVIKFYSYSIRYTVSERQAPYNVGPFTYVKLESLPASSQLDPFNQGAKRHKSRVVNKALTKRRDKRDAVAARKQGKCLRVANSGYCYRTEDRGYVRTNPMRDTYNRNHNSFTDMSQDSRISIRNYTNTHKNYLGANREIYSLRTGQELFVPQDMTDRIIERLRRDNVADVRGGADEEADADVRGGGGGILAVRSSAADTGGRKKTRRKRRKSRKKRRKSRKRRKRRRRRN